MTTGVEVTKSNVYTVAAPPTGVDVTKADVYTVVAPPAGAVVTKAVVYTVVQVITASARPVVQVSG